MDRPSREQFGGEGARMDAAGQTAKIFQFSMADVTQGCAGCLTVTVLRPDSSARPFGAAGAQEMCGRPGKSLRGKSNRHSAARNKNRISASCPQGRLLNSPAWHWAVPLYWGLDSRPDYSSRSTEGRIMPMHSRRSFLQRAAMTSLRSYANLNPRELPSWRKPLTRQQSLQE